MRRRSACLRAMVSHLACLVVALQSLSWVQGYRLSTSGLHTKWTAEELPKAKHGLLAGGFREGAFGETAPHFATKEALRPATAQPGFGGRARRLAAVLPMLMTASSFDGSNGGMWGMQPLRDGLGAAQPRLDNRLKALPTEKKRMLATPADEDPVPAAEVVAPALTPPTWIHPKVTLLTPREQKIEIERFWPRQWIGGLTDPKLIFQTSYTRVYKCSVQRSSFDVAVKVLDVDEPRYEGRVGREIMSLNAVNGGEIVSVYDVRMAMDRDGRKKVLIMMEALDGNWKDLIIGKSFEEVSLNTRLAFFLEALRGVKRLHDEGLVHRNIKPENIFIARDPVDGSYHAKLGSLGSSCTQQQLLEGSEGLVGTREYMAPEVWNGRRDLLKSDVWSLGISLCELVAGELPAFFRQERLRPISGKLEEDPLRVAMPVEFDIRKDEVFQALKQTEPEIANLIEKMCARRTWRRLSITGVKKKLRVILEARGIELSSPRAAILPWQVHVALQQMVDDA